MGTRTFKITHVAFVVSPLDSALLDMLCCGSEVCTEASALRAVGSWGPWAPISSSVRPGGWNPLPLKDPSSWSIKLSVPQFTYLSGGVNESCLTPCSFIKFEKGRRNARTVYRTSQMLDVTMVLLPELPCRPLERRGWGWGVKLLGHRGGSRVPSGAVVLGIDLPWPPWVSGKPAF